MFLSLLSLTFLVALLVCFIVSRLFSASIDGILERIVGADMAAGWARYVKFAVYVVGVAGGVPIAYLEELLRQPDNNFTLPALTTERWFLEIYRTVIEALQSIAWVLLLFFLFALVAYVAVRIFELFLQHRARKDEPSNEQDNEQGDSAEAPKDGPVL